MNTKKNSQLLTKNELGLLVGSFLILGSLYVINIESNESKKIKVETVKKIERSEDKNIYTVSKRKPANHGVQREIEKPVATDNLLSKLRAAEDCVKNKNCNFPNTDPRSYNLTAHKNLAESIVSSRESLLSEWNKKTETKLKYYLSLHNGFVKEAALKTINKLSDQNSEDFVDVVIEQIIHDHNAQLMEPTMKFIKKINDPLLKAKIEIEWINALLTGSPNKSEALAKYSHQLINQSSLPKFKDALNKMPYGSAERAHLESSIKEFEMTQSGG